MTMNRSITIGSASAAVFIVSASLLGAGSAHAATPVEQACVGTTFSNAAHNLPPGDLGAIVMGFAQEPGNRPGIGDGIQNLQAGNVSDDVAPNTCND
jgi:hypothetical protein